MQTESREPLINKNFKSIIVLLIAFVIVILFLFRNLFFQPIYLLKSFGELSVDPEIAFNNNKPTFLEFYAEWCEVCQEMSPKVFALKEQYDKDINFVFLNVDNQKWDKYIKKFDVNGIPQVNLLDRKGVLKSSFIGKQQESTLRNSIDKVNKEINSNEQFLNPEFSRIKETKNSEINPRNHG
jgi:thiol-disulfide isomerase/thioredoxin